MKNKTLIAMGCCLVIGAKVAVAEQPEKGVNQAYFEKRCMAIFNAIAAGDREALFKQVPPMAQNWQDGKAWRWIDRAIKRFNSHVGEGYNIRMLPEEGGYKAMDDYIKKVYPNAIKQYDVAFWLKGKDWGGQHSCRFIKENDKWHQFHILPLK